MEIDSSDDEFYMKNIPNDSNTFDQHNIGYDSSSESDEDDETDYEDEQIELNGESVGFDLPQKIEENEFGDWYDVTNNDYPPNIIPFTIGTSNAGPQVPTSLEEPIDFFKLFFTDELISTIVKETNEYANTKIVSAELPPGSIWRTWKPVDNTEMSAFIGVVLNMGLIQLNKIQDYWSQEFNMKIPFFATVFKRDRFLQIFWMIRLNETVPNPTPKKRIQKVNNFLNYIESKFHTYYVPTQNISIDESVIKIKGKISFISQNKNKPTKWGVRIYVLADSSNGYIYSILPYYGRTSTDSLIRPDLPLSTRIVLHLYSSLLQHLPNAEGYHIFSHRYFSTLTLAHELLKLKCHFTGTINKTKKLIPRFIRHPEFINNKKTVACRANNVLLLAWKDKRIVRVISTNSTSDYTQLTRKNYGGTTTEITKPKIIVTYSKFMRGIETADQIARSYCFLKKSLKWWRKLFFWGLEICSMNAYILYKKTMLCKNKKPFTRFKFVSKLVKQLVGDFKQGTSIHGRQSTIYTEERLDGKSHFISNSGKKRRCLVCSISSRKGERHETRYCCETCLEKPGLHGGNCFKRYHTMKDYKIM